jgi:hypothetical protein
VRVAPRGDGPAGFTVAATGNPLRPSVPHDPAVGHGGLMDSERFPPQQGNEGGGSARRGWKGTENALTGPFGVIGLMLKFKRVNDQAQRPAAGRSAAAQLDAFIPLTSDTPDIFHICYGWIIVTPHGRYPFRRSFFDGLFQFIQFFFINQPFFKHERVEFF